MGRKLDFRLLEYSFIKIRPSQLTFRYSSKADDIVSTYLHFEGHSITRTTLVYLNRTRIPPVLFTNMDLRWVFGYHAHLNLLNQKSKFQQPK